MRTHARLQGRWMPELADLPAGFALGPVSVEVDQALVVKYRAALGDPPRGANGCLPPGLVPVLARSVYLPDCTMPPGAVLLTQWLDVSTRIQLDTELIATAVVSGR